MLDDFANIIGAGAIAVGVVAGTGFVPRVGPLRAIVLAFRSKARPSADPFTNRTEELQRLYRLMKVVSRQQYIVVFGQKGTGKSCLVNSATSRTCGIINIEISSTKEADEIVDMALRELTKFRTPFMSPAPSARRVIWWYTKFASRPPLVVVNAIERKTGASFANISAAVRILTEKYGLRVIVDGSTNSLQQELFRTGRCKIMEVFPMSKNLIRNLPQLESMFQAVENAKLDKVVWEVLGGLPSRYEDLNSTLKENEGKDEKNVIGEFLLKEIGDAIKLVRDTKIAHPQMKQILALFDDTQSLSLDVLVDKELQRPVPDKVLREVKKGVKTFLVPSTKAIGLVLRFPFTEDLSVDTLQKIVENLE